MSSIAKKHLLITRVNSAGIVTFNKSGPLYEGFYWYKCDIWFFNVLLNIAVEAYVRNGPAELAGLDLKGVVHKDEAAKV